MKLSISYKHVESQEPVEKDVQHRVEKLNKLLKVYAPDLVQLHGVFGENPHKEEYSCTLNCRCPLDRCTPLAKEKTFAPPARKLSANWKRKPKSIRRCCARTTSGSASALANPKRSREFIALLHSLI